MNKSAWRLCGAFLLLFLCSALQAVSPVPPDFQFIKPDLTLLEESNQIDQVYARKGLIVTDPEINSYLEFVGNKVLGNQASLENVTFRFRIIRDPMVNAYALPNGTIYVTSGLIALLQNEAQLAGVLSHEITHVTHRHSYLHNREMRKEDGRHRYLPGRGRRGGQLMLRHRAPMNTFGNNASLLRQEVYGLSIQAAGMLGQAVMIASIGGYGRDQERLADDNGIARMVAGGYDPHAIPEALSLLDEHLEYEPLITFYRDHPEDQRPHRRNQQACRRTACRGPRHLLRV